MLDPVVVRFAVGGLAEVDRAFESILRRMERTESAGTRAVREGARARIRAAEDEEKERERAYAKLTRDLERHEAQQVRDAERTAKKIVAEETRAKEQSVREFERLEKYKLDVRRRSAEMAGRIAEQEARAEITARQQAARALGSHVRTAVGGMASTATTALTMGGGFLLADAASRQMHAERAAAQLVNSATIGGKKPAGATVGNILARATQTAGETGVDRSDLISGVQNYVAKSSDFAGGMENMGFFAKLSKATGSRIEDVTGAAGILRAQNKDLSNKDMKQMLLDMMEQGKQGAVEISDMASLAGALGSTRGLYQGSATTNQRKLLGLSQLTRTESESPEEAATAVKDLGSQAVDKASKKEAPAWLKHLVDAKTGQIKGGPEALILGALTGTGGNLGKLESVFGQRGAKVFDRLAPIFNKAGGGQAGIEAVQKEMNPIINAQGSEGDLDKQLDEMLSQPAEKLHRAWETLTDTVAQRLEPVLEKLADDAPDLADKFATLASGAASVAEIFLDHPWAGLGAIVAGKIGAEIAKAQIADLIKHLIAGEAGGVPVPGGGGGKLLAGATGVGVVAAMGASATEGQMGIMSAIGHGTREGREHAQRLIQGVRNGTVSPAEINSALGDAEMTLQQPRGAKGLAKGITQSLGIDTLGHWTGLVPQGQSALGGQQFSTIMAQQAAAEELKKHTKEIGAATRDAAKSLGDLARHSLDLARHLPIDQRTGGGS